MRFFFSNKFVISCNTTTTHHKTSSQNINSADNVTMIYLNLLNRREGNWINEQIGVEVVRIQILGLGEFDPPTD